MGAIAEVTCQACGAKWQCRTGCGLLHGRLETVADFYSPKEQEEIKDYAGKELFPFFDFRYQLSHCVHCRKIVSVPVLKIGNSPKAYASECEQCRKQTKLIEDITKEPCPVCGKTALKAEETGQWD